MHATVTAPSSRPVQLHIIGDGALRPEIEQWIRTNNMTEHILLLGWQANVASWMRTWHLFAMSSLWEGLPCSVVEARLCKLPVVAYDVGGIKEVVFDGKNGFLVPAGNWQLLADRLTQVVADKELQHAFKTFHDQLWDFDSTVMLKKHQMLYTRISSL